MGDDRTEAAEQLRQVRNARAAVFASVLVFLVAGAFALVGALVDATEDGDGWGGTPRALLVFGVANIAAAVLASVRPAAVARPLLAPLVLIPAVTLMNEGTGGLHPPNWLLVAGASVAVLAGGFFAGGLWGRRLT